MNISSVSTVDYIKLVGQYNTLDMVDAEEKLRQRGFNEAQIKVALSGNSDVYAFKSLDLNFAVTKKITHDKFDYLYTLYSKYDKNGVMPHPGSHSDQSAQLIEYFAILKALEVEREERSLKEAQRKNGKR